MDEIDGKCNLTQNLHDTDTCTHLAAEPIKVEDVIIDDETIFAAPDPEPVMPPGLARFLYANQMVQRNPANVLVGTYCVLHDLIELLVKAGVIKLSELEQLKKDAAAEFRASRIVTRGN